MGPIFKNDLVAALGELHADFQQRANGVLVGGSKVVSSVSIEQRTWPWMVRGEEEEGSPEAMMKASKGEMYFFATVTYNDPDAPMDRFDFVVPPPKGGGWFRRERTRPGREKSNVWFLRDNASDHCLYYFISQLDAERAHREGRVSDAESLRELVGPYWNPPDTS